MYLFNLYLNISEKSIIKNLHSYKLNFYNTIPALRFYNKSFFSNMFNSIFNSFVFKSETFKNALLHTTQRASLPDLFKKSEPDTYETPISTSIYLIKKICKGATKKKLRRFKLYVFTFDNLF